MALDLASSLFEATPWLAWLTVVSVAGEFASLSDEEDARPEYPDDYQPFDRYADYDDRGATPTAEWKLVAMGSLLTLLVFGSLLGAALVILSSRRCRTATCCDLFPEN